MEVKQDLPRGSKYKGSVITIGFYDGVHRGHQRVIREVVNQARMEGVKSCVITFDPHPSELFSHNSFPLLTTREEKREILGTSGIDLVIVFPFTRQFACLSPSSFIEKIREGLEMRQIIVGEDFVFGREKEGNIQWLKEEENKLGYKLKVIPLLRTEKGKVSSSLIRDYLKRGDIKEAAKWLGRPPTILGKVGKGRGRGRLISYPTANLKVHPCKLLPSPGVYAGRVILQYRNRSSTIPSERKKSFGLNKGDISPLNMFEDKVYDSIINIGSSPTFGDSSSRIEAHIINFEGDIYGQQVKIELMEKIRKIRKFPSALLLAKRLEKDKEVAQRILNNWKNPAEDLV